MVLVFLFKALYETDIHFYFSWMGASSTHRKCSFTPRIELPPSSHSLIVNSLQDFEDKRISTKPA